MTKPPPRLRPRGPGRRLWAAILAEYEPEAAEIELLTAAARTLDEIETIELALDEATLLVPGSTGQERAHPLLGELRAHRVLLARLLGQLELDAEPSLSKSATGRHMARLRWDGRGSRAG